jgi:hypothetical protein
MGGRTHVPSRKRRLNWDGGALAALTFGWLIALGALALGAGAGSQACAGGLALLVGGAVFLGRRTLADSAGSVWRALGIPGAGWIVRAARVVLMAWGAFAMAVGTVAVVGDLLL